MNYYLKQFLEDLESYNCTIAAKRNALSSLKKDIAKYEACLEGNHDFGNWEESSYSYKTSYYFDGELYPTVGSKLCWERTCSNCGCIQRTFEIPYEKRRF